MPHPVGLALELEQPPVVHDAVYHRGRHLVVAEDGTPPRELEVGGEDDGQTGMCSPCTKRYHLEQEWAFNEQLERGAATASSLTSLLTLGASGTRCGSATVASAGSTGSRGDGSERAEFSWQLNLIVASCDII